MMLFPSFSFPIFILGISISFSNEIFNDYIIIDFSFSFSFSSSSSFSF